LREAMRLHRRRADSVIGDVFVSGTETRALDELVKELPACLPIVGVLFLCDGQVIGIRWKAIFGFIRLDLLLRALQEERPTGVAHIEGNAAVFQIFEGVEKVALPSPSMWSAEIGDNVNIHDTATAPKF